MTDTENRKLMGYVALACAVFIALAAFLDHKVSGNQRWLMVICTAIFGLVSLQLLTAATGRFSAWLGGVVCTGFSCLGLYVAFSRETLGGGVPFIPSAWNQTLGHALFGVGALVTGAMAVYFFKRAIKSGAR